MGQTLELIVRYTGSSSLGLCPSGSSKAGSTSVITLDSTGQVNSQSSQAGLYLDHPLSHRPQLISLPGHSQVVLAHCVTQLGILLNVSQSGNC